MSPELWIMILAMSGGFIVNSVVIAGVFMRFALANEARMTRMETNMEHLLRIVPKRKEDSQ